MATKEMTIKLMVDTESDRLIFAEASKDFVDFLIYLLSLPIGTATKLLTSESMVGSIGNIYTSVANLDETYLLRPHVNRDVILNPMVFSSAIKTPLPAATSSSRKFYTCGNPECRRRGISDVHDEVQCPECHGDIYLEIQFIDKDSEGYVHDVASYMISDDLSITSISTVSIMSMMSKFDVTKPEERVVKIGTKEALELLKVSLQSTTVLTDVFLKRKKRKQPEAEVANLLHLGLLEDEILTPPRVFPPPPPQPAPAPKPGLRDPSEPSSRRGKHAKTKQSKKVSFATGRRECSDEEYDERAEDGEGYNEEEANEEHDTGNVGRDTSVQKNPILEAVGKMIAETTNKILGEVGKIHSKLNERQRLLNYLYEESRQRQRRGRVNQPGNGAGRGRGGEGGNVGQSSS